MSNPLNFFEFEEALYGRKAVPVEDEGITAEHDKHYHKQGFNPETDSCKFRERDKLDNVDIDRPSKKAQWLQATFGIKPLYVKSLKDFDAMRFNPFDSRALWTNGRPVSREVYDFDLNRFYEVVKDLTTRYSDLSFDSPFFVPFNVSMAGGAAASSLDRRFSEERIRELEKNRASLYKKFTPESYIALGDLQHLPPSCICYHHQDERYADDVIRHEIGHNLATKKVHSLWLEVVGKEISRVGKENVTKLIAKNVSLAAALNEEEAIAEIFSLGTDKSASKKLPKGLQKIVDNMLTVNATPLDISKTTEDSLEPNMDTGAERIFAIPPKQYTIVCPFNSPPRGKISWWDSDKCKYVEFESQADKIKYILAWYGVDKTTINRVLGEFPNKEWDVISVSMLIDYFFWNPIPLEEAIEKLHKLEELWRQSSSNTYNEADMFQE